MELVEPEPLPEVPLEVVPDVGPLISEVPVGELRVPDVPLDELPEVEVPDVPVPEVPDVPEPVVGVSLVGEGEVPVLLPDVLPVPVVSELPAVPPLVVEPVEPVEPVLPLLGYVLVPEEVPLLVSDVPDEVLPLLGFLVVVVDPVPESLVPDVLPVPVVPELPEVPSLVAAPVPLPEDMPEPEDREPPVSVLVGSVVV